METAGQRIRRARKAAGLRQNALAKRLGISPSTLSELESGDSNLPSLEVAIKMSEELGVTLHWIIYGEEGEILTPTAVESEFLSVLRDIPDESRAALLALAKSMSKPKNT